MNSWLNISDYTLSACNEIVITGDQEFIADGTHELILDNIYNDCINSSYLNLSNQSVENNTPIFKEKFETENETFEVYPNPFHNKLHFYIKISHKQNYQVNMYNIYGQNVASLFNKTLGSGTYEIDFSLNNLSKGVYFLRIESKLENRTFKLEKL